MKNFILKFFTLFLVTISLTFFSLIFIQKANMEGQRKAPPPSMHSEFRHIPPQEETKEPPLFIPLFIIIGISSLFILFLLNYLNKNFILPLGNIQDKLKSIKDGNLYIKFDTDSENNSVIDTYSTLNDMIGGLIQKEKLQNEFIQKLSHDLRAPLVAQERAIEILKDEFNNHELLDGLLKNSQEYINMINIVLQSFNQKEIKIEKIEFNFHNMLETLIQNFNSVAAEKNIKIINQTNKDFLIYADYVSMLRVFGNLIGNSIENIGYNKQIKIFAQKDDLKTIIKVEDNGDGIAPEIIPNIFDKYKSGSNSKKIVSGLGLYIVKELVEKNSGNIKLESELKSYTRFIIELPNGVENEKN